MTTEYNPDYNIFNINLNIIDKKKMKELNLDIIDLLILRWFHNWYTHYKMLKEVEGGTEYYWVNYSAVVREFDIGGITSISGARKRLLRLCGEEGNDIATPLLKRITRNYKAYSPQVFFHLNEPLFFSVVSRGNIGSGIKPPEIDEELSGAPIVEEVPVEESSEGITPETLSFIDNVLSRNPQFSKPRINIQEPSKTLVNIQNYRMELLDGTFMERHRKQLPVSLREVVLPVIAEEDILSIMGSLKLSSKMSISDYFLSYNNNTKAWNSMFISYMSKATKSVTPPAAPVSEVKTTGMHPRAVAYIGNERQVEAHKKLGVTDIGAVARVADSIYSWYEDHPNAVKGWQEYMHPKNLMWAMKNFMEPWKEKTGKSADDFYKTLSPFDTSNRSWTLFARYMWKHSNVLLHNKLSCPMIQDNEDAWYWIDYKALRVDID